MKYFIVFFTFLCCIIGACGNSSSEQKTTSSNAVDGRDLYNKKCGICHGRDGKLMASGAPDLTISKMDSSAIVQIITAGKGNMPPHKETLTPSEIEAVAQHVLTLRAN